MPRDQGTEVAKPADLERDQAKGKEVKAQPLGGRSLGQGAGQGILGGAIGTVSLRSNKNKYCLYVGNFTANVLEFFFVLFCFSWQGFSV